MTAWMAGRQKWLLHPAAKPLIFVVCLLPFAWLFYAALIRATGD